MDLTKESDVYGYLIRWPSMEAQDAGAAELVGLRVRLDAVLRRRLLVDEVGIEDVELVSLHHLPTLLAFNQ